MSTAHEHNSDDLSPETPTSGPQDGAPTGVSAGPRAGQGDDPVVSIIVVSYNTREMTLECLRSIGRETPDLSYEVLFIDNQSTDGSWEAVHEEFNNDPRFTLRLSEKNLGFAGANNEMAKGARGEYILLLNPDTLVLDKAIEKLVQFAREYPDNGIWGGRTVFADGSLNPTNCFRDYTIWSQFCRTFGLSYLFPKSNCLNPRSMPTWDRSGIREVPVLTGCFFLVGRKLWDALDGFDNQFFMFGEEVDLCLRARRRGNCPVVNGSIFICHHGSASLPNRPDRLARIGKSEIRLIQTHWRRGAAVLGVALVRLQYQLRSLLEIAACSPREARVWSNARLLMIDLGRSRGDDDIEP